MNVHDLIQGLMEYPGKYEVRTIAVGENSRETHGTGGTDGVVFIYTSGGEGKD
jgi:hypothetical protein